MKTFLFLPFIFLLAVLATGCSSEAGLADTDESVQQLIRPGTTLGVEEVTGFTWMEGLNGWRQPSYNRLLSSRFTFGNNGRFTYQYLFDANTVITCQGEYFPQGGNIFFFAQRSTNNGAGSGTQVLVEGRLSDLGNGRFTIGMEYGSGANFSATVNNQQFFNQSSKRFRTTMTAR